MVMIVKKNLTEVSIMITKKKSPLLYKGWRHTSQSHKQRELEIALYIGKIGVIKKMMFSFKPE